MAHHFPHGSKLQIIAMYKECLHNHAAHAGGYALDGCSLFEPGGPSGTRHSATCAACGCHRSFHRRVEVDLPRRHDGDGPTAVPSPDPPHSRQPPPPPPGHRAQPSPEFPNLPPAPPQARRGTTPGHGQFARREAGVDGGSRGQGRRLDKSQSKRLRVIAEVNDWKMFRDYSKEEIVSICEEVGINKSCFKAWVAYHRHGQMSRQAVFN
ncbi:homeobox protein 26 [Striga asiatica]|uniref:Homeobox protein 26 n=1 Tax=Striga asiatica TaxID=4170 RepID=A0A5A7QAN2_STRAF|nr:homeobox protein 26 [Striga asiatica]